MIQCVSILCVLGIVILGLLTMTRAVDLEQTESAIGRVVAFMILAGFAYCMVRVAFWAALALLKHFIVWIAIVSLVIGWLLLARVFSVVKKTLGFKEKGGTYE